MIGKLPSAHVLRRGPIQDPVAQLTVLLERRDALIVQRGPQPPEVMLIIDDSLPRALDPVLVGAFQGPSHLLILPVSAALPSEDLLAFARARRSVVRIGSVPVSVGNGDRRNIAALYMAALCGLQ